MEAHSPQGATYRRQEAMGHKLHPERLHLDLGYFFLFLLTVRTINCWNNLHRDTPI